ncbi:MAG: hypothetical protein HYS13_04040 [Planctomycetia bacterium]|nr:hypothetical protein [Planctomycetia bacterium]
MSLRAGGPPSRRFPAILDTGHSLNLSIREEHVRSWAGLDPQSLKPIGRTTLNDQPVILRRCNVALYRNVKGQRDRHGVDEPVELVLREGIVVHPQGDPTSPRLPLLGLRSLARNGLKTTIDGRKMVVWIWTGLFAW